MTCNIENAETVNCGCCDDAGTLYNVDNKTRIVICDISAYTPVDIIGPPVSYNIDFFMKSMGTPFQQWVFTTAAARDSALANVDMAMKTVTV